MNTTTITPKKAISASALHRIITGFEEGTLPREEWTHEAHLIMALWNIYHHPKDDAIRRIREGIWHYNEAVGIVSTPTSGYHETLTLFYIRTCSRFLSETGTTEIGTTLPIITLVNIMLASEIADRAYPLRFYSKERLFSPEARATWIEPEY